MREALKTGVCTAILVATTTVAAAEDPIKASGWLARQAIGDTLEKDYQIGIMGWAEATLSGATHDDNNLSPGAFFNQDSGFNLNNIGLMLCRGDGCPPQMFGPQNGMIGRIGPFPTPPGDEFDLGFNATFTYGEDSQFLRISGFDDFTFDADNENKIAIPQLFVDAYIPVLDGLNVMLGSFQTPLQNEIGYPFTPPNWFVSKTYAFQHGPAKHVGGLAQLRLPTPTDTFGFLSLEAGVVGQWNALQDFEPNVIAGVRWRSPDFKTHIDVETIVGDGEGDAASGPSLGGSPYVAISTTNENLTRFNGVVVATHQATDDLALALEATYGFQEGGDAGIITEDSAWYGVNVGARYRLNDQVHLGARAEWFNDENAAHILWAQTGATGGDVYALTRMAAEPLRAVPAGGAGRLLHRRQRE